jgi:hypothetical protein
MKIALAHTGLVQKVMEKVMPQSWAVGHRKVTPIPRAVQFSVSPPRPPLKRRAEYAKPAEAGNSRTLQRPLPYQPDDSSSGASAVRLAELNSPAPIPEGKSETQLSQVVNERPDSALSPGHPSGVYPTPWLGLLGLTVTPDVAQAMNLASDQQGVLVEQVQQQGPADRAHLGAGSQSFVSHGHRRLIGGDVIVALDGQPVSRLKDMQTFLQQAQPGQTVTLTLLQGKEQRQVSVTLGRRPASILSPSLEMMLQREPSFPAQPPGAEGPLWVGRTPLRGGDSDLAGATF